MRARANTHATHTHTHTHTHTRTHTNEREREREREDMYSTGEWYGCLEPPNRPDFFHILLARLASTHGWGLRGWLLPPQRPLRLRHSFSALRSWLPQTGNRCFPPWGQFCRRADLQVPGGASAVSETESDPFGRQSKWPQRCNNWCCTRRTEYNCKRFWETYQVSATANRALDSLQHIVQRLQASPRTGTERRWVSTWLEEGQVKLSKNPTNCLNSFSCAHGQPPWTLRSVWCKLFLA